MSSAEKEELLVEINQKVKELEARILTGDAVLAACRKQMKILKNKLKEYNRLQETVSSSAADGNL